MATRKTTTGIEVELVDYISGGTGRKLGLLANMAETVEQQEKMQDAMIESCVKSVNGKSENLLDEVLKLDLKDYLEIITFCTELFAGFSEQKKTK